MTAFRRRVLAAVRGIRKGDLLTYRQVAQMAGSSHAARAVGNVLRENYDPAVPCHRVIRSDGTLGNYNRGGTKRKRLLLLREAVPL